MPGLMYQTPQPMPVMYIETSPLAMIGILK